MVLLSSLGSSVLVSPLLVSSTTVENGQRTGQAIEDKDRLAAFALSARVGHIHDGFHADDAVDAAMHAERRGDLVFPLAGLAGNRRLPAARGFIECAWMLAVSSGWLSSRMTHLEKFCSHGTSGVSLMGSRSDLMSFVKRVIRSGNLRSVHWDLFGEKDGALPDHGRTGPER